MTFVKLHGRALTTAAAIEIGDGQAIRPSALVTGAARRIGRTIAERLAQAGYGVGLHCHRSRHEAETIAGSIELAGGRVCVLEADLADASALPDLIAAAGGALGPLTLLVNNASVFEPDSLASYQPHQWHGHFSVNLEAPVALTQAFARQAHPSSNASVVNIIDQRVWRLNPLYFTYTLSKAALWTATQTMAQALAPRIRVNAIGPGPTLANERQSQADFRKQAESVPLRCGSSADEIAGAVLYLAGAKSVTGQMIAVDGGQHLAWLTPDVDGVEG
jgi:NAD(P)-dependent dehydrogenase (short-subunit alcohol dehydrogenase family)